MEELGGAIVLIVFIFGPPIALFLFVNYYTYSKVLKGIFIVYLLTSTLLGIIAMHFIGLFLVIPFNILLVAPFIIMIDSIIVSSDKRLKLKKERLTRKIERYEDKTSQIEKEISILQNEIKSYDD